jgi:deoxyribose-phosphate aldolase
LKKCLGKEIKIKASGGIRTLEDALRLIEAGASRLGSSSSVRILKDFAKGN